MMQNTYKSLLLIVGSFLLINSATSQIATRKQVLLEAAKNLDAEARYAYSSAIIKAKEKGWSISYTSRNKNKTSLMGLDFFGQPIYYTAFTDPVQTITINTNKVWPSGSTGLNLSGASDSLTNKIAIWDEGGVRNTHKEMAGRVTQKDNVTGSVDHSTHVMGIIMSKAVNPLAKGMAYDLKGAWAYDWNSDASEMAAAAANGLLISNHSYGTVCGWDYNDDSSRWEYHGRYNEKEDYRYGLYNSAAAIYDSIAYNAPNYLIVKSAGNSRSSNGPSKNASGVWYNNDSTYWRRDQSGKWINAGLRPDSLSSNNSYETLAADNNAKNILTIGAVAGIQSGYSKKEDVVMSSFSCWGPTDDGRIKPDLVADGVSVYSPIASNDSSYGYSSGTSMSAPSVSGALSLLQELSYRINARPLRAATIKALAIQTTNEAGLYPGPDYKFGWGLLNTSEAAICLQNALSSNNASTSADLVYEGNLLNGASQTYTVIPSGKKAFKVTLVWTDVKGNVINELNNASPKLINDLDLKISIGSNTIYPWNLNRTSPDNAAFRGNNSIDNVEKIEVDSALIGNAYTITVSHKNTLSRDQQAYSLIISGVGGATYCSSTANSTAGTKLDSVSINNIVFNNTSNNQYIDNSHLIINGEPTGILPFSIKSSSTDASNSTRFIKIFIDLNNNGSFETAEEVAVSTGINNGTYSGTIQLPADLIVGSFTKLRIVAMETNTASNVTACGNYNIGETQDYTLKIKTATNDLQLAEIVSPTAAACKKSSQYVTVKIINNGSTAQSNFPIQLNVKKGSTTIKTSSEIFTGTLAGLDNMLYTFQAPFSIEENANYTITATVSLTNDQQINNNTVASNFIAAAGIAAPTGEASNCNSSLRLMVNNPFNTATYLWYDSSSQINPISIGATSSISSNATQVKLASGYTGFVEPASNTSLGSTGGYNSFNGNYVKINARTALTIETAKLYTGYPGKIEFILATIASDNADGSYSYYPIQTVSLNVGASSPSPAAATTNSGTPFVAGDTGRTYYLNLKVPQAGDYIMIVKCTDATIFRNNGLGSSTYPSGPNKLFSFTGNSVSAASGNYQNYFYFFYNTQISTNDCPSPFSNIPVVNVAKPIITQNADTSLSTSLSSTYQWYSNDSLINGATNQSYRASRNAMYRVVTSTAGCTLSSDPKLILVTALTEANAKEIALKITSTNFNENLIKGNSFYIQFSNIQTRDISLDIINSMGERVFHKDNLLNQMSPQQVNINTFHPGIYFVRVYANNKVYTQRVFLTP